MKTIILDIETTGLEATASRIICISFKKINSRDPITNITDESERELLKRFWTNMNDNDTIVTFNGDEFDLPFIIKRSIINNVKCKKFQAIDLRKITNSFHLHGNRMVNGSLKFWAGVLGIEVTTSDGSTMPRLFEEKKWQEIAAHCEEDVQLTEALYYRVWGCGLL